MTDKNKRRMTRNRNVNIIEAAGRRTAAKENIEHHIQRKGLLINTEA